MNKVKIIWKSNNPNKKYGYIRISIRLKSEKKTKVNSLKLPPIHKRHFDTKRQRVKSSHPDYEMYNSVIENTLNKYKRFNDSKFLNDNDKSLSIFVKEKLIPNCNSVGTKQKYQNILNLLELYNENNYNRSELLFRDIDEDFVLGWKKWLKMERGIFENSISYKTKTFKSFINKSIKQNYYTYYNNPFNNIKNEIRPTKVDFLDEKQVNSIMFGKLYDVIKSGKKKGEKRDPKSRYKQQLSINDVRNFFLLQLLFHGLRVSDLSLLRWNNLVINGDEIRLKKIMLKTKYPIDILVYKKPLLILFNYVPDKFINDELKDTHRTLKNIYYKFGLFSHTKNEKIGINYLRKNVKVEVKNIQNKYLKFFENNFIENHYLKLSLGEFEVILKKEIERKEFIYKMTHFSNPFRSIDENKDEVNIDKFINKKIEEDEEIIYLKGLKKVIENKVQNKIEKFKNQVSELYSNLYNEMREIIKQILSDSDYSNRFILPLLKDKDFENITDERKFEVMDETQYNKLCGRRSYYNSLLKMMGNQLGIPNLTSHKSRHTFTSLMLKKFSDINLYDLSISLGHQNIKTTENYIQNFTNKRIDDIGEKFSNSFGGDF